MPKNQRINNQMICPPNGVMNGSQDSLKLVLMIHKYIIIH